jgi:hypothetical protein
MKTLLTLFWLVSMLPPASAEQLGRLFFTPAQRAQMDYNYARDVQPGANSNALMLNGIVQMRGGKRTAWINGVPQTVGPSDDQSPASLPVRLPGQNRSVKLKVGQRVLLDTSANPDTANPETVKPDTAKPFSTAAPAPGAGNP